MEAPLLPLGAEEQLCDGVGRVHLVDFEFAGSNWRSFDLANVLLEASIDNQVCVFTERVS
jgi:thiamine kinase-like enzyme